MNKKRHFKRIRSFMVWVLIFGLIFPMIPIHQEKAFASTAPAAPTMMPTMPMNNEVILTWTSSAGATSYEVYEGTSSGTYGATPVGTVSGSTTSFIATGLTNGTTYYFAVKAVNSGGSSGYSNEVSDTPTSFAMAYTVNYDGNGNTGGYVPVDSNTYPSGSPVTIADNTENLTKSGNCFAGWNTQKNGGGTAYAANDTYFMGSANVTLYAQWQTTCTVTFNSNGGSAVADETVTYNTYATQPTAPTKTGYTFGDWYSDSGLTNAFNFTTTPITANTTLYAKWSTNSYTVTFNSNGGSAVASETVTYNTDATQPAAPTKTGYTFGGWYSDSGLTNAFNFTTTPITADTTLYAKWTANSYTVTFNSNGGSAVTAQTVQYNNTASKPADPTKTSYTFGGWYSDSGLSTSYNFSTPVTGDVTLYAKWQVVTPPTYSSDSPPTYAITYNGNGNTGGSVPTNSNSYLEGTSSSVAGNTGNLTKTGYTFAGWNTKADGSGTTYAANATLTMGSANVTLYAIWKSEGSIISTIAGTGSQGYSGDGGPADKAQLSWPFGVAVDNSGNVYIAETDNNRIRKIAQDGTISTVAGTGIAGYSGDGGPADKAKLNSPVGIAVDGSRNMYIADSYNNRIRKIAPDGTISTVAGTGTYGYSGDGGPADKAKLNGPQGVAIDSSGNVYIADTSNSRIRKVASDGTISTVAGTGIAGYSGDGGPADKAQLNFPLRVAVDSSGNMYIADMANNRIRKIAPDGTISTVAGTGTYGYSGDGGPADKAKLNGPGGIAVDSSGNVYIVDTVNQRIRKIAPDGTISTVAGTGSQGYSGDGGAADKAKLNYPNGVAVDGSGNVYIADTYNSRIRKVTVNANALVNAKAPTITKQPSDVSVNVGESANLSVTASVDSGTLSYQWYKNDTDSNSGGTLIDGATSSTFDVPTKNTGTTYYNVVVTNTDTAATGNKTASTTSSAVLVTVNNAPIITTVAGTGISGYSGDGGPADKAQLKNPYGVAVDGSGNVYIADTSNNRILKIALDGTISTVAGTGSAGYSGDGGPADKAKLNNPAGIALDGSGNLFIADRYNNRIRKIAPDGTISTVAGTGGAGYSGDGGPADKAHINSPIGITVDGSGNVYFADRYNSRIRKIATDGTISTVAGTGTQGYSGDGGPADKAQLNWPYGVAVDSSGNLYITDFNNNRVRKVTPDGTISTVAGTGVKGYSGDGGPATKAQLSIPSGIAIDGSGNLYITEYGGNRIRKIAPDGTISTVAGTGVSGYSGDGGPADQAKVRYPLGVAVDSSGNVYIADMQNNRIRKITMGTLSSAVMDAAAPTITQQPEGATINAGESASLSVTASVDSGTLSYQWYSNDTDSNSGGTLIDGATSTTYDAPTKDAGETYYYVVVTNTDPAATGNKTASTTSNAVLVTVNDSGPIITTIAGTGTLGYSGDGGSAEKAHLNNPYGVAVDSNGNVYIADTENNRIRKIAADGTISTVAGTGIAGYSGDGGPADKARLNRPSGIALDDSGNLYIADRYNNRIRKVSTDGTIQTVAGTGAQGYSGDGGPADKAQLNWPFGVALDNSGNYYIADMYNHRIRKVAPDGTISTVAGTGIPGYSGDGGPADKAQLNAPSGIATDGNGNVYIADTSNHRIRKISADGNISTVAGTGTSGYSGDGGPAKEALLQYPYGVAVDNNGNVYIVDASNHRIRKISADGNISTVAGTGTSGYSGDGGPADKAQLYSPDGVAVDSSGNVYIADKYNFRIRKVTMNIDSNPKASTNLGTVTQSKENGQSTTTLVVNDQQLQNQINSQGKNGVVTIQNNTSSDNFTAVLNGQSIQNMGNNQQVLQVKTDLASYSLPANQINPNSLSNQLGTNQLSNIQVSVQISIPSQNTVNTLNNAVQQSGSQLVSTPVEFSITATSQSNTVQVSQFNSYVERTIAIPSGVNPSKVTTGVVLNSDGTVQHVPTQIVTTNGKYYAEINSLTNSTYAVISHSVSFADVENHWAKQAVNHMGSLLIVSGVGSNEFAPNKNTTRGEFAVMITRALGLKPTVGSSSFKDVKSTDWYSGAIETANEYHLISGYEDGTFRPKDQLTREQAMVILSRAMKLTGLSASLSSGGTEETLKAYSDVTKVSSWAKSDIAASVQAGIIGGRTATQLAPQSLITRAEVAVILERLLKKSGLI